MTAKKHRAGNAPLRRIAVIADMPLHQVYARFRQPGSPAMKEHVACIPSYDIDEALEWLRPGAEAGVLVDRDPV